ENDEFIKNEHQSGSSTCPISTRSPSSSENTMPASAEHLRKAFSKAGEKRREWIRRYSDSCEATW
ncbi:hypothetical protein PMAYCL1PPCAC_14461, partial [Pristionchus mayeri]